ncbi:hypothetical protein Q8F55_004635 [Vanrija albida]|uniref:Uncharacterized protein n=1 Tax=Vanrija albida TaxID=181172 RepID=A0ABR3Q797_9TREE
MRFPLLLAVALLLGPAAAVPVAQQFALDLLTTPSAPFLTCHDMITRLVNLPGWDTNFPEAVTLNCRFDKWKTLMTTCLLNKCVSAPDLAYAAAYGRSLCGRAGVPDLEFEFPAWFLQSAGGAYYK